MAATRAAPFRPEPGQVAVLKRGVSLRTRPDAGAETLTTEAGERLTLKVDVTNAGGKWWYVTWSRGSGWVREGDLEQMP